jgi:hypothetical protein
MSQRLQFDLDVLDVGRSGDNDLSNAGLGDHRLADASERLIAARQSEGALTRIKVDLNVIGHSTASVTRPSSAAKNHLQAVGVHGNLSLAGTTACRLTLAGSLPR